jgi:hypothetical protein
MKTFLSIIALAGSLTALAQQGNRQATLSGGLEIGIPVGEFDATWGRQLAGLSGNFAVPMRRLPISYGFDFAWASMGSRKQEVTINEETIESTTGDLSVKSNVFGYHALLRLQPFTGKVSPFAEVLGGMRQFTTQTEIEVEGMDQPLFEQRNEDKFIASTGWAAGVQVMPGKQRNFFLEGRVESLTGGQVTSVDPRSRDRSAACW